MIELFFAQLFGFMLALLGVVLALAFVFAGFYWSSRGLSSRGRRGS